MTDRPDLDAIESDLLMYETANTEWVDFIEGRRPEAHDPTAINAFMADTAPTALRSLLTYARALEQERDEARRDAETAAAAENANAADLKAARDLLVEQQRAFVVAVEAMEARHDAEIAGIVEGLRERADALVQDDRFDAASALNDLADSIATTHAAALARHAGRNTGGSNG